MATEDEAREAADGTEVQVEAVDLGTVHLQAHPEGKLPSLMEIKSVGEIIDSTEGTLNIPEDQVLVEAPSDVQLPPEHNLNGEASSLNGHTGKEEKVSNEQTHDSDQEEAELDQSNGTNKKDVTDGISHEESTKEDSCLLKHKKDEEPKGDDQQNLAVTVDDYLVQEDTLKTDNAIEQTDDGQQDHNQEPEKANENTEPESITNNADVDNAIEQTDDGQQDQNQEPEKANENTEPASIANNADVEIVAEAATELQAPVEKRMNNSDDIPENIDEKTETDEPAKADGVVDPEEVAKVEDQQSRQADMMDAVVAPEETTCEETDQQEEKTKSKAHEPIIDAQGVLNQEYAEETDDPMHEKIEETAPQRDVAAPKETTLEHEATMSAPPVNTQVQNQESLEEIEDTEAEIQPSSSFGDAIPEDQSNVGVTIDNDTVNEDTMRAIEQQDDGQQDEDLELEKATEHTQSASITNISHAEIVTEAPSGVQTPGEPNVDNSEAVPDTIDANAETDEPAQAHAVVHPDHQESFPEDTTAEPTEEVVKAEDQQSQQADAMDANMLQEEVPKSEHNDDPATDALEVLNQESAEEIDGPVNTEGTAHKETTPEYDTTRDPPVDIQAQNQESLEEREDTVEEREVAEAVDIEAPVQQSSVAFEEAVPEDQHYLGVTDNTVQEETLGQTKDGHQYQELGSQNATENTQPASTTNIPDVEVITEAPSESQTPLEINLDISDAIPYTTDGNTEKDEPAKADVVVHPEQKESFSEDTFTAEPTEEVVKVEDQQSQQADAVDADVVQEEVPKSEHTYEPATDALEVLNQESAEETDGPENEKTEETAHQSNMPASEETTPEYDATTREPPVNIQVQNQEPLDEREATVEERDIAEVVGTEASVQQSSVALEEAVPEDQHNLGFTNNTVQEDTPEAIGQTKDGERHQDVGPQNATENTQAASMANIPEVEVITEAPSESQTPVEINLDISDAIPDTTDGNTETDEIAKADVVVHPETKESCSEDTCIAEPTEEVIKVEEKLGQQADAIDVDVLQEEAPKSEHADEQGDDALEVLNQESTEETDGLVNVKTEETEHKSNMVVPEDTMPEYVQMSEPSVYIQEHNQESVGDAEAVHTEAEMQQSSVAFEETTPENYVATTEPCSEIQHVEPEEINVLGDAKDDEISNMSNTENLVQDNILQSGPTIDIQPVQELEQIKTDEVSNQTHAVFFNGLAQEDATETSEPQMTGTEELKDTEATEAEEITKLDHVTPSKEHAVENDSAADEPHNGEIHQTLEPDLVEVDNTEDTVEDNVAADEPSCGSQEVDDAESTEETKQNIAESTAEASDVVIVDETIEQNMLQTEDITETYKQELEPEETKSTEPVESEEASDQRNAAQFDYSAQEDNIQESEMQQTESATEIKENEPIEVEAVPQESSTCVSEEPSQEDQIKESETSCDNQEVNITESSEVIDGHKDIITGGISDQSNTTSAGDSAEESNVREGEPPANIQAVQELGSEEIKNTQIDEVNETSLEMNDTVFLMPTQEENRSTTELHESTEASSTEATEVHGNPHQCDAAAQSEEQATEEISSGLKPESIEDNDTEANESQSTSQEKIIATAEESVPEEVATEDNVATEPDVDHQLLQDQESAKIKETEAHKFQEIASSNTLSSDEFTSEDNATSTEPNSDTQADNSQLAEETEDTETEAAAPETDTAADTSSFHEANLEETKDTGTIETEDVMTSNDYTSEKMDMETMEIAVVPHESNVANIKEHTEDDTSTPNAPHAGTEPVCEQESVEDSADTMEHPGETHGSTSDELTPTEENTTVTEPSFNTQEAQNLLSQEIKDSEDDKTDEFSDISSFPTPGEADEVPRIEPTPDVQEVQELSLTEESRDTEAVEPEDQQEHTVSTLEKPAVDSEPNADDQQVHEDKQPEVEDNKATEADEASKQSNISTPDNAAEERNELESYSDSYAQQAEQVELSEDNENSQLVKAEETSDQSNSVTLEERTTEDPVASEIDPPVDIKQEQPVEEIKGVDATEAEEDLRTSQAEPTYDIQQVDGLEAAEEKKNAEDINDGEQSNISVSEESTLTDNGATPEYHHVESNEGTTGNETDNVILAQGIKDEIQKSEELKDDACDLDETVLTSQRSENMIDEDAVQTSGNDTIETSNNINQVKEEPNAGTEHNSSQMPSESNGENATHVQDRDVDVQILTESGNAEASHALFENDPQAAQDTTENDDTTKGSEQTSDHDSRQHGDVALQQQSCEEDALSILEQDEALQKIDSDKKQNEDEIEIQNDELQVDEQKHEEKRDDLTTEPLVEYQNFENGATNKTKDNDTVETEQTEALHISRESTPSIMDMKVENIKETSEGTEEDDEAKNDNNDKQENAENNDIVAKTSINEQGETTDETTKEEIEPGLVSSVQEASEPAPSKDKILENDPVHFIQESEKEIADEIEESKEIHEDNAICHDELQTDSEKEESPQLRSNEPYNVDAKIDDTTPLCEEITHDNASIKPREIEEIEENKGLNFTSEPFVESSIQNNVEDSSSHHKVEEEKLSMSEKNVDTEAMQEKNDEFATDINQTEQCQEEISPDDVLHLKTEENSFDKIEETSSHEETETSRTVATEAVTINEEQDEKDLQDENKTPKENNEEDMQNTEIGEAKKEVEQELPVSHFLMNLILGKESSDANEDSESEAARTQGEATEDGSCTFVSKQEESMGSLPTENKVDNNLTFVEQEKHEIKCSEETQEMVKGQSDDLKLDIERSIETDEDIKKNTHDLEIPAYQDNPQDENSLLTGEAAGVSTKMESRDIDILSGLDARAVGTVSQENMEVSTTNENGSLRSSLNDSTNTKAPQEDTLGEEQTGLVLESLSEDKSVDAVSEQAPSLTESGITDASDMSSDTTSVQNPVSAKQDKPTESANVEATCYTDIQLENEEVDKKEEAGHANTASDEVSEENVESSHVNMQKITSSEVTSNELATQITEPVCDTQTILAHEKEIYEENFPTAVDIQADGPNMQINQDKQDEVADNETGTEQKSPKETDEGYQQLLAKKEIPTQEQDVHETVESPQQTVSIKSNEGQELFDSKVQERDLNVVSPREASEAEENFVDVTKPEFSTDEEQSPRADAEEKIYDEKIKDIEGTKNFTDEAAMKTEAPGEAQKARKKHGLLSGVGSKVKHQLAKVKKAIVGKPGRTKPESPKA